MTRALIIDDHVLFAEAIKPALESAGITVVEAVTRGADGVAAARRLRPDLVLVDIGLPDQSGLAVGRRIIEELPETKVLVLTALEDPRAVREAMRTGFHGYLTKDMPVARFVHGILASLGGQLVVPRRLAAGAPGGTAADEQGAILLAEQLTAREREVLSMLVEGASGPAMSRHLRISPNTVRTHIQSILTKLQVHSRLEAATFAVRHGIVEAPGRARPEPTRLMRSS